MTYTHTPLRRKIEYQLNVLTVWVNLQQDIDTAAEGEEHIEL
jgi:hypothetical protein